MGKRDIYEFDKSSYVDFMSELIDQLVMSHRMIVGYRTSGNAGRFDHNGDRVLVLWCRIG